MQKQYIDLIKGLITEFKTINLEELFALSYPDRTDIGSIQIDRLSISEYINISKRFFEQLEVEINSDNGLILPLYFTSPEFGQSDVPSLIRNYLAHTKSRSFSSAETQLVALAQYQLQNGFYDKSKYKSHSVNALEIKKSTNELLLQKENIKHLREQYDALIGDLNQQKKSITDFQTQKQGELQQIVNNLETTNINTQQIQSLLTTASQSQTKINSLLEQIERDKQKSESTSDEIDKVLTKNKTEFADVLKKLNETETNYLDLYSEFEGKLNVIESKFDYFKERNEYLDNLIGREVGASLFETFKQRKIELTNPLIFWRAAVGVMGALTFVVILAIFTNIFGWLGKPDNVFHWENILVNALKSSPLFFLLYYTISQYNKERNFQEEYAFKSAVALTIKAYSDVLHDDKNKDELILKAVYGIYRSPIYAKIRATKEVNSALDMIHDLVGKGTELLTKK
ncbi:hypothetical protein C3K47_04125 [Solitalea longa]|uniref:Uncharacterized protein n=1 Tax=Solitalea longa TaxID=2079460 RepID=A0A2S5A7L0_9SPHI|nr:hypothetical protein [Solitalea longa]POY38590.1 hypothetical protein C3K47_04125 [Solitalea longa]